MPAGDRPPLRARSADYRPRRRCRIPRRRTASRPSACHHRRRVPDCRPVTSHRGQPGITGFVGVDDLLLLCHAGPQRADESPLPRRRPRQGSHAGGVGGRTVDHPPEVARPERSAPAASCSCPLNLLSVPAAPSRATPASVAKPPYLTGSAPDKPDICRCPPRTDPPRPPNPNRHPTPPPHQKPADHQTTNAPGPAPPPPAEPTHPPTHNQYQARHTQPSTQNCVHRHVWLATLNSRV